MTLDDELQALKRKAEERISDVAAWTAYSAALEREGRSIDSCLDDNIVRLGAMTKSILLAQLNTVSCPDQHFSFGEVLPGVNVETLRFPASVDDYGEKLYLIKDRGLYRLYKYSGATYPDAPRDPSPRDTVPPFRNLECTAIEYLRYGQKALLAIRELKSRPQ